MPMQKSKLNGSLVSKDPIFYDLRVGITLLALLSKFAKVR